MVAWPGSSFYPGSTTASVVCPRCGYNHNTIELYPTCIRCGYTDEPWTSTSCQSVYGEDSVLINSQERKDFPKIPKIESIQPWGKPNKKAPAFMKRPR